MNLLGYVRVSTDDQAKGGHSLAQQPDRLLAYCKAHGHELAGVVIEEDGVSASIALHKRKGGADLLRRLRAGEAEGVVVVRIDRLFRDLYDGVGFFRNEAFAVHSIAEHIDTSSAAGRLGLNIQLVLADHERDRTAERTKQVIDGMRQDGKVYGSVPYGCVAIDGMLYRAHPAWWWRQEIVDAAAEGASLERIAQALFRARRPSPNGAERWSKSTIANIVATHDGLCHLPWSPADPAASMAPRPDLRLSAGGRDAQAAH